MSLSARTTSSCIQKLCCLSEWTRTNNICLRWQLRQYSNWKNCQVSHFKSASINMAKQVEFHPQKIFADKDYAVVILNRKIKLGAEFFVKIWNNASIRHVVDGGANRFFTFLDAQPNHIKETVKFPNFLNGDFDSITAESMSRLKDAKTECTIIPTPDQDETDFTKALRVLRNVINEKQLNVKRVIVICECSGRLDHIVANINTLHKNVFLEKMDTQVFMMGSEVLCWLLPSNCTSIIHFEMEQPNLTCGIIPFLGATTYSSAGLQWNLSPDMVCKFGGIVSTSNNVVEKTVRIQSCDENPSIFSVELASHNYV